MSNREVGQVIQSRKIYTVVRYPDDYIFIDSFNVLILLITHQSECFLIFFDWNKLAPIKRIRLSGKFIRRVKYCHQMRALCAWSHENLALIFLQPQLKIHSFDDLHNLTHVEFVGNESTILVGRINEPSFSIKFDKLRVQNPEFETFLPEYSDIISIHYEEKRDLLIVVTLGQMIVQQRKSKEIALVINHNEDAVIKHDPKLGTLLTFRALQTAHSQFFTLATFWSLSRTQDRVSLNIVSKSDSEKMKWERMVFVANVEGLAFFVCYEAGNTNAALIAIDHQNGKQVMEGLLLSDIHPIMSCIHYFVTKKNCFLGTVIGKQFLFVLPRPNLTKLMYVK